MPYTKTAKNPENSVLLSEKSVRHIRGMSKTVFPRDRCTIQVPVYRYIPQFYLRDQDSDIITLTRKPILTASKTPSLLPRELYAPLNEKKVMQPVSFYYPDNKYTRAGVVRLLYQGFWMMLYTWLDVHRLMNLRITDALQDFLDVHKINEDMLRKDTARRKWNRYRSERKSGKTAFLI